MAAVQSLVAQYPGIDQEVLTYTDERGEAHHIGETASEDVVVRVFGQEYDVLTDKADEVARAVGGIDGVGDVALDQQPQQPQIDVRVDLAAARRYAVTPGQVRRAAATLVSGIEVGSLFEQQKVFEVVVWGHPALRHDIRAVEDLLIDSPTGHVRLGQVADVEIRAVPTAIKHSAVSRYVDVVASLDGADAGDVAEEAEKALTSIEFPLEYHAELLEDYGAAEDRALMRLAVGLGALVLLLLLFQAYLRSWLVAAVAVAGWPVALSGGLLVAAVMGADMNLGLLLGLVVLTGVYTRAFLTLHTRYEVIGLQNRQRLEGSSVMQGAQERFLPTFGSAVAVAALFIPVVVLGSGPGLELLHPMAVVILGGLVTTTAMNLLVLPIVYTRVAPDLDPTTADLRDERLVATSGGVA
jgi:Cu/Ag efflux pump CusA